MECNKCQKLIPDDALFCPYCGKPVAPKRSVRRRGNGSGYAFKRGNTWTARVTLCFYTDAAGNIHRKYKTKGGFPTKKAALDAVPSLLKTEPGNAPTLLELWNRYEQNALPKLSYNKRLSYRIARKRIEDIIYTPIDRLRLTDLEAVVAPVASQHYSAKDIKVLLSHLYNLAIPDGYGEEESGDLDPLQPFSKEKQTGESGHQHDTDIVDRVECACRHGCERTEHA